MRERIIDTLRELVSDGFAATFVVFSVALLAWCVVVLMNWAVAGVVGLAVLIVGGVFVIVAKWVAGFVQWVIRALTPLFEAVPPFFWLFALFVLGYVAWRRHRLVQRQTRSGGSKRAASTSTGGGSDRMGHDQPPHGG